MRRSAWLWAFDSASHSAGPTRTLAELRLMPKKSAGRHPRHSLLNDIIWRALQRAQIPSIKEPTGLVPNSDLRPTGTSTLPWARGRCLASPDVTRPTRSPSLTFRPRLGARARRRPRQRLRKRPSTPPCPPHTCLFPLAFKTLGAWGEQVKIFVAQLGRRITEVTGDARKTDFLRQRLAVAIQRGNALAIRGSLGLHLNSDCDDSD